MCYTVFWGNKKHPDFKNIVENMLLPLKYVGCNLGIKFHFLHGNIDFSPENLGDFRKERLHQDTKETEKCSGDSLVFKEGM